MSTENSIITEEFYGIHREKLELVNYECMQHNDEIVYWIHKIFTGKTYITSARNEFPKFRYKIYNSQLNETNIKVRNWEIISIKEKVEKHSFSRTFFKISDRFGVVQELQFYPEWHDQFRKLSEEESILAAVKFLHEISRIKNWESVPLFFENKKLKKEIDQLKKNLDENQLKELNAS
ncbi:MAG: hypothetical protein KA450_03930 [Bacteroidia bacterium]|nr:hypothetical protein [Bacteroidia bacterium]